MSNVQEALKSAIEAIERPWDESTAVMPNYVYETVETCKAALAEIEKCEPVGELILDPVFLPALKAPLVNWKINLVDLEVGTKFYTSPQPIEKSEPVYLISSGAHEIAVSKAKYDEWTSAKRISYTSPISKEWVVIDEKTIDDIGNTLSDEQGFIPVETWTEFARAIEAKLKQLNVLEKG